MSTPKKELANLVLDLQEENFQLKEKIKKLELENSELKTKVTDLDKKAVLHQEGLVIPKKRI